MFILKRPNDEAEFDTVGGSVNRIETKIHKTNGIRFKMLDIMEFYEVPSNDFFAKLALKR